MERLAVGFAKLRPLLQRFKADENGSVSVEYILMAGGIGVVTVAALEPLREIIIEKWAAIAAAVSAQ